MLHNDCENFHKTMLIPEPFPSNVGNSRHSRYLTQKLCRQIRVTSMYQFFILKSSHRLDREDDETKSTSH